MTEPWQRFEHKDPFNPQNYVEGSICVGERSNMYGALQIEKVNGVKVSQTVLATPKMHYPFDQHGNWHFPKAKRIERFLKLDGTNIFQFRYKDAQGSTFVSYKLRLQPFLHNSKWGPFLDMWGEMLRQHPEIEMLPHLLDANLSYELWGGRNMHLIQYDVPLATSLLFGRKNGNVVPPTELINLLHEDRHEAFLKLSAPLTGLVERDYVWEYQQAQAAAEKNLTPTEGGFNGQEGEIWYILDENGDWNLFKMKPETIESIHWATGGLNKLTILATCQNAFEQFDEPTIENVKTLLLEEFPDKVVEDNNELIATCLTSALERYKFNEKVMEAYNRLGISILTDRSGVMRAMSSQFARNEMSKVYGVIASHVGG